MPPERTPRVKIEIDPNSSLTTPVRKRGSKVVERTEVKAAIRALAEQLAGPPPPSLPCVHNSSHRPIVQLKVGRDDVMSKDRVAVYFQFCPGKGANQNTCWKDLTDPIQWNILPAEASRMDTLLARRFNLQATPRTPKALPSSPREKITPSPVRPLKSENFLQRVAGLRSEPITPVHHHRRTLLAHRLDSSRQDPSEILEISDSDDEDSNFPLPSSVIFERLSPDFLDLSSEPDDDETFLAMRSTPPLGSADNPLELHDTEQDLFSIAALTNSPPRTAYRQAKQSASSNRDESNNFVPVNNYERPAKVVLHQQNGRGILLHLNTRRVGALILQDHMEDIIHMAGVDEHAEIEVFEMESGEWRSGLWTDMIWHLEPVVNIRLVRVDI